MSILFGGTSTQATTTTHETALNVQSSSAGKVVGVVLGTRRIAGNLCWYDDFTAIAHTTSSSSGGKGGGGGGSSSTSYTYTTSVIVGLSNGTIQGVGNVWSADDVVSLGSLGSSVSVKTGATAQSVWPWLSSAHNDASLGYSGLAYVGIAAANLGSSANLPNWNWEVRGLGTAKIIDSSGNYDIGFPEAIQMIIGNAEWGCGTSIPVTTDDYATWCDAHGFVMSDSFDDATSARDIIGDYLTATLSEPVWMGDSIEIVPYADQAIDGYTPDLTPDLIVDSTMLLPASSDDETPIRWTRKDPDDLWNYVSVEYLDRNNDYNTATVTATDDAHIATYGRKTGSSVSAHFFSSADIAQHAADLVQAREISNGATGYFRLGPIGALLQPMKSILWINDPDMGLVNHPVRVKEITEEDQFVFSLEVEELPGVVGTMVSRTIETLNGHRSGYSTPPGLCNAPIIFEAPGELTSGTGLEIWIAVSGTDSNWAGCQVWVSTDDATYARAGFLEGSSRTGSLTSSFPSGSDPDESNILSVSLSESRGVLASGTLNDANIFSTLCRVGDELISYETADLTGEYAYDLEYLRRGAYGTSIASHSAGERFARLDGAIFKYPFSLEMVGKLIYVKCLGYNSYGGGIQSLADVVAYPYVITGGGAPSDVTGLKISVVDNMSTLSWNPIPDYDSSHYWMKFSTATSAAGWDSSVDLNEHIDATSIQVPAMVGTYLLKAVDRSGSVSANAALIVSNTTSITKLNVVELVEEAPEWSGEKTDTFAQDGALRLDYADDWFSVEEWFSGDDWFLGENGIVATGSYAGSEIVDLGEVYTSRVSASLTVGGLNEASDWFDGGDWFSDDWFAVDASSYGAVVQIATTSDDPADEIWSDWQNLVVGDYTARAFKFRLILTSSQFGVSPIVSELSLQIDMPDRVEAGSDIECPVGGVTVTFDAPFRSLTGIAFNDQEMQPGDVAETVAKSETSFTRKYKNSSGTDVSRSFDYVAKGYGRVAV